MQTAHSNCLEAEPSTSLLSKNWQGATLCVLWNLPVHDQQLHSSTGQAPLSFRTLKGGGPLVHEGCRTLDAKAQASMILTVNFQEHAGDSKHMGTREHCLARATRLGALVQLAADDPEVV